MKLPKPNQRGITHILAPLLFIAIFAGIGAVVLKASHAAPVVTDGGGGGYTNGKIYSSGFTINPDGTGYKQLNMSPVFDQSRYHSNMSFGGKKVAYIATIPEATTLTMGYLDSTFSSTSNTKALASLPAGASAPFSPVWSPDGVKVAVAINPDPPNSYYWYPFKIWIARTDSTASHIVPNVQTPISPYIGWSPRSASITYALAVTPSSPGSSQTGGTICTIEAIGINNNCHPIPLSNTVKVGGWLGEDGLAVSPTGGRVAMAAHNSSSSTATPSVDIYTVNPDGSGLKRLTTFAPGVQASGGMVWSPDGTKIAYYLSAQSSATPSATGLYVMNADGTGSKQISTNYSPGSLSWAHQ